MSIILDGTTGITAPAFDGTLDATDLTGDVAAARIATALNATGDAPIYACRAWVNFNGTGTVAIRASGNVSSITDNGTGSYAVNFATAMPDANYAVMGIPDNSTSASGSSNVTVETNNALANTTAACNIVVRRGGIALVDTPQVNIAIFR